MNDHVSQPLQLERLEVVVQQDRTAGVAGDDLDLFPVAGRREVGARGPQTLEAAAVGLALGEILDPALGGQAAEQDCDRVRLAGVAHADVGVAVLGQKEQVGVGGVLRGGSPVRAQFVGDVWGKRYHAPDAARLAAPEVEDAGLHVHAHAIEPRDFAVVHRGADPEHEHESHGRPRAVDQQGDLAGGEAHRGDDPLVADVLLARALEGRAVPGGVDVLVLHRPLKQRADVRHLGVVAAALHVRDGGDVDVEVPRADVGGPDAAAYRQAKLVQVGDVVRQHPGAEPLGLPGGDPALHRVDEVADQLPHRGERRRPAGQALVDQLLELVPTVLDRVGRGFPRADEARPSLVPAVVPGLLERAARDSLRHGRHYARALRAKKATPVSPTIHVRNDVALSPTPTGFFLRRANRPRLSLSHCKYRRFRDVTASGRRFPPIPSGPHKARTSGDSITRVMKAHRRPDFLEGIAPVRLVDSRRYTVPLPATAPQARGQHV